MVELLVCRELVVGYEGRGILPAIDLAIGQGELWIIAGQNGSGKTTWLRTLLGLLPPVSGAVSPSKPGLSLCYLSQRQSFDPHYPLTVRDVVEMGLERKLAFFSRNIRKSRVDRALELTSTRELAARSFHELSEGQKQRVLLARVQAAEADLAVLDEPTSAMDGGAELDAWQRLKELQRESGVALVVVTHSVALAARFADHALWFDRESRTVRVEKPASLLRATPSGALVEGTP